MAQATKDSEEREARMTREIERLLNDHDKTNAHTMTCLEKRLDAKSDLMMRKLDEILNRGNWEERSAPRERSRQANDGDRARSYAGALPSSRTNYESYHRERNQGSPIEAGLENSVPPEADAPNPQKSRRTLKTPKSYKDESDGCIDTWIEAMKLQFEEDNLSKTGMHRIEKQPRGYRPKMCNGEKD